MTRRIVRLIVALIATFFLYLILICAMSALVFDDPWRNYNWWQSGLLWMSCWMASKAITPPIVSWIKKESK